MYDYESHYESAEVVGESMSLCDVCGIPIGDAIYLTSGRGSSPAVADRLLRVCGACYAEIEGGEIQVFADGAEAFDIDGDC
ncbi:MAG TPA: hypothetical protein VHV31_02505 [Nitrolancea sp.]|jgi:hypothetical protein|nr:hypothetical protein [Nitrolancea sp.]